MKGRKSQQDNKNKRRPMMESVEKTKQHKTVFPESKMFFIFFTGLIISEIAKRFYSKAARFHKKHNFYSLFTKYYAKIF